jgi:polyhydroxybutyrate depolymerase
MITAEFEIDSDRIFAAGHSNGGMLAYRLACELSDRLAAVGLQAGSLGIEECSPSQPVSLLHIHGTADRNHPIDGGVGTNSISNVDYRSAMFSSTAVAAAMGCESEPTTNVDAANPDLGISSWTSCQAGVAVQLVAVSGASHAWMGHPVLNPALVGESYPDLDASVAILEFLLNHQREGEE